MMASGHVTTENQQEKGSSVNSDTANPSVPLPVESQRHSSQARYGVPLSSLPTGGSGTILTVKAGSEIIGHLMGMGLFAGSSVTILQKGLSSRKPILVGVGDTRIAMGHEFADMIFIEPNV